LSEIYNGLPAWVLHPRQETRLLLLELPLMRLNQAAFQQAVLSASAWM